LPANAIDGDTWLELERVIPCEADARLSAKAISSRRSFPVISPVAEIAWADYTLNGSGANGSRCRR